MKPFATHGIVGVYALRVMTAVRVWHNVVLTFESNRRHNG